VFLLPRIELSKGECVFSLDVSEGEALPLTDPREVASRFQGMGAVGLHIVDVDAAQGGHPNDAALVSVFDAVHIPVQCGGGVRSLRRIQELRDTGARRVVVGTMSVLHPDWFQEAVRCFPEGLLANLDEKHGTVWIKGRTVDSGQKIEDVVDRFDTLGLEGIVITSLNGSGHAKVLEWTRDRKTPIMVDVPVRTVDELVALRDAGVKGAILGRELYDRTLDLDAAMKAIKGS
jgi:phosphoribosylformimino-5-aminoimidazole carboxamide ribotide isomerase